MFKGRSWGLLLLAVLLAGGAAWLANQWASKSLGASKVAAKQSTVAVAAIDIPYGYKVEEQHVKLIKVAASLAPPDVLTNKEDVIGKVASVDALAGDILRESRFVEHLEGSTLASLIAPNMRAVSLRVDDVIGVGGFLLPGNRVDVLASKKGKGKRYSTETVLRDIKVLAIDQRASTNANDPVIVRAVTLEVAPKQAEDLVTAGNEGKIQLALRNPNEEVVVVAEAKPAPKVRRTYTPRMNIIRGTQISTVKQK